MSVAPTWHSPRVIAELSPWLQVPLTVVPRVAAHPDRPPRSSAEQRRAQEDRQGKAYIDMLLMVQAVMVRCEDLGPIVGDYGIHVDEPEMTVRERAEIRAAVQIWASLRVRSMRNDLLDAEQRVFEVGRARAGSDGATRVGT